MPHAVPALTVRFTADRSDADRGVVSAVLSDYSTAAIHELSDGEWRVFFRSTSDRDAAAAALARDFQVEPLEIADEDWARRSQENLRSIAVGEIVIAPPWDIPKVRGQRPEVGKGPMVIVIEPSTGFGTGHHATTRLCLRALQRIDLAGKTVIDVGTGSGVLAIAAALRGATRVVGIDNDPDALEAARANVERNRARVELRLGDLEELSLARADVVIANLTGAMLRRTVARLAALAPAGVLIVSGFLVEEAADVESAFAPLTLSHSRADEDGWAAIVLRMRSASPIRM